jgi:hypothetical protein
MKRDLVATTGDAIDDRPIKQAAHVSLPAAHAGLLSV